MAKVSESGTRAGGQDVLAGRHFDQACNAGQSSSRKATSHANARRSRQLGVDEACARSSPIRSEHFREGFRGTRLVWDDRTFLVLAAIDDKGSCDLLMDVCADQEWSGGECRGTVDPAAPTGPSRMTKVGRANRSAEFTALTQARFPHSDGKTLSSESIHCATCARHFELWPSTMSRDVLCPRGLNAGRR